MKSGILMLALWMGIVLSCSTTGSPSETGNSGVVKGVNFSQWFEASSPHGIQFTKYTEQDFINAKSLGVNSIRLPINLHSMTLGAPDYQLDPLFLEFLDIAVDWAEKYQLRIILDNHSFDPVKPTEPEVEAILLPVWAQMAEHFKDRGEYVLYEVLNEPHGIAAETWGAIQGRAIETIRQIDTSHIIIVGGIDYNSVSALASIPEYTGANLMYTFHFYDPYLFTHQGATWGEPSLASLRGVPFPYDKNRMPKVPADLAGTWIPDSLTWSYPADATYETLEKRLDEAAAFAKERGVPVFCGEFGVYIPNSPADDRVKWYAFVARALDARNIARTSWDYFGGFGLFKTENSGDINSDLNTGVVKAMGFTPPPQKQSQPVKTGFVIYDEYPAQMISVQHWGESAFDLYDTRAAEGKYALRWSNPAPYNQFSWSFGRPVDWTYLKTNGYAIQFMAKARRSGPPMQFDVRFINSENETSIPWRIRYQIDETKLPADGEWHTIRIPLTEMREQGAWLNTTQEWRNPQGLFSWDNIARLEFTRENEKALLDCDMWFDDIEITK